MKWFAEFSPALKRAWIVDEEGFTVIGPVLPSFKVAKQICIAHNRETGQ
jgi:hypothetical protein